MIVGVPRETKTAEHRVAITPVGVRELTDRGHKVLIEKGAGDGSSIHDAEFEAQGATIVPSAGLVFDEAEMILKVKEPQASEVAMFREDQILFTYLHLAAYPDLAAGLAKKGIIAIAYETVQMSDGSLPLLARCQRSQDGWRPRQALTSSRRRMGAEGYSLGVYPESVRARLSSWVVVWPDPTQL